MALALHHPAFRQRLSLTLEFPIGQRPCRRALFSSRLARRANLFWMIFVPWAGRLSENFSHLLHLFYLSESQQST